MERTFFNFDLALDRTDDGEFVRVTASPADEAVGPFQPPLSQREVTSFHQSLLTQSGTEAQQTIRQVGERLYRAIFTGNIRLCWDESLRLAYEQRAHLRLRLNVQAAPEYADLPWEYLYDPQRQEFAGLTPHTPLVRHVDLKQPVAPFRVEPPLRMLVVVANPGGQPLYDEEDVWLRLVDTLDHLAVERKLVLERLIPATVHELQRRLRNNQYHILHYIGHGVYDGLAQEHRLLFENEMGRTRPVNSQHLGALVHDHFALRLVTLQACPTAQPARQNPFIGVAQQLLRRGLPAAVAIHQPLPPAAHLPLADDFYRAVADLTPVDLALTEARRLRWITAQDPTWGEAALFLRITDGGLFVRPPESRPTQRRTFFSWRRP